MNYFLDSSFQKDTIPELIPTVAVAYRVKRSPTSNMLFSCYAVDYMDNLLYPIVVDVDFEVASSYAKAYNADTEPNEEFN